MNSRLTVIAINAVVILLLCLLLFIAGTWWRLNTQYALGEAAFNKGDFSGAVAGFESAIHLYLPFNEKIELAAQKLWSVGQISERQGDVNRALIAYRALRSSFYADRWLTQPGKEWIARCDARIATLVPLQKER